MAGYFRPLLTWLVCAVCCVGLSPLQEASAVDFKIGGGGFCPGGTWEASTSTCTTWGFTVGEGDSVFIPSEVILINGGILYNHGTLTNAGDLFNNGILDNTGTLGNTGTLDINGALTNTGALDNSGTLYNTGGTLTNTGALDNSGTLYNTGTFTNCGIFTDTGDLTGNSIMPCDAEGDGRVD